MTYSAYMSSNWVHMLRTQVKTDDTPPTDSLSCPYCSHSGCIFRTIEQLFSHATVKHTSVVRGLDSNAARVQVQDAALRV